MQMERNEVYTQPTTVQMIACILAFRERDVVGQISQSIEALVVGRYGMFQQFQQCNTSPSSVRLTRSRGVDRWSSTKKKTTVTLHPELKSVHMLVGTKLGGWCVVPMGKSAESVGLKLGRCGRRTSSAGGWCKIGRAKKRLRRYTSALTMLRKRSETLVLIWR